MKQNVGQTDMIIRIVLGLIIGILGIAFQTWWGLLGLLLLVTGIFKICPLYLLLKLSTLQKTK